MKYIYVARILLVISLCLAILGAITQIEYFSIPVVLIVVVAMVLALISLIKGEK